MAAATGKRKGFGGVGMALVGFAVGYFTANLLRCTAYADRAPVVATVLGVVMAMMAARRIGGLSGGAFRGLGIGVAVGVGLLMSLMQPAGGEGPFVEAADLMAKQVWIATSVPAPGPLAAGAVVLAIHAPELTQRIVPTGPGAAGLITVLVPAVCCLGAGAVCGLAAGKRQAG